MTVEVFVGIGYIAGVECILGRVRWLRGRTYRAFAARPSHVLDLNGELLGSARVLVSLASGVRGISSYATYVVRNGGALGEVLARVTATAPAVAGRGAGVTMLVFLVSGKEWSVA